MKSAQMKADAGAGPIGIGPGRAGWTRHIRFRHATWNQVTTEKLADVKISAPVAGQVAAKPAPKHGRTSAHDLRHGALSCRRLRISIPDSPS
jgi:hypothetical protein